MSELIRGRYHLKNKDPNRPAQKYLNELSAMKSTDSRDIRDEISKAMRCKKTGNMERAIKHLKLSKEILNYTIKQLSQKDKMKAFRYFKDVF